MVSFPQGIANMGSTLVLCDTGNKSIRLIGNAGPPRKLSSVVFPYAQLFDLDHYRGKPRKMVTLMAENFFSLMRTNGSRSPFIDT